MDPCPGITVMGSRGGDEGGVRADGAEEMGAASDTLTVNDQTQAAAVNTEKRLAAVACVNSSFHVNDCRIISLLQQLDYVKSHKWFFSPNPLLKRH